jgi:hypothetical protein
MGHLIRPLRRIRRDRVGCGAADRGRRAQRATRLARALSTCIRLLLLLPLPISLQAGLIKDWQLKETESAPVLVTGRILRVHKNGRLPQDQVSWKAETWATTADVEVLRSFTASGMVVPSRQIKVYFLSYGPSVTFFINGYPPPLPDISSGEIRILPLRENRNPASEPWQLMADSGLDLTIPVRADTGESALASSARAFLIREFANTLSSGTPGEIAALSGYLLDETEDLSGELMPLLGTAIGGDRQRWAEIAASLYAAEGVPRPTVADFFSAKTGPFATPGPGRGNLPLLQAACENCSLLSKPMTC